jgi:hypothetical protein
MSRHDAFMETFPLDLEGYIDDSLCPTIDLFVDMFFVELLKYCDSVGIIVSDSKFQKSNAFGKRWTMNSDRTWAAPVVGFLEPLGKRVVMTLLLGRVDDRPERLVNIIQRTLDFIAKALSRKRMAIFDELESLLGVWMYIATTNPAITPLLQYPLRNLHAKFNLTVSKYRNLGTVIPLRHNAVRALNLCCAAAKRNPGIAFMQDTSPVNWATAIWVVHDAAGFSEEDPDSYRGHFTLIYSVAHNLVHWVKGRWTAEELLHDSTTLESCGGNCALEKVLEKFPQGDIIECFDSLSATCGLRRLACHSETFSGQIEWRGDILTRLGFNRRIFIFWFPRESNTLCDNGSKGFFSVVMAQLQERGLPPLNDTSMPRAEPRF